MPSGKKYIVVAIDIFMLSLSCNPKNKISKSIMLFIESKILMRHRCPKRIQIYGGKP